MISNTFRGLDRTYQDLMMLTPQQLADVSRRSQAGDPNAPPSFLIVAALDAQNKAQQRQMQPPTQTVAENVVAQAAQNQYQNRLAESGVAALPTARPMMYEGGGLVSFADGGPISFTREEIDAYVNPVPPKFLGVNLWSPESPPLVDREIDPHIREKIISDLATKYGLPEDVIKSELELAASGEPRDALTRMPITPETTRAAAPAPTATVPSDVSTTPEHEPTYEDYFKIASGLFGAESPELQSAEKTIEQYKGVIEDAPLLGGPEAPKTVEAQIAANRAAMRAAGIDPEAELQRQVDLANKRRKETEEYKEKGKADILLQLGAAMMAGRSPHALVNIGEALKGTGTAIQEYRNAIDKRNELADEAEELARQAAYKQRVGDYEGAKKTFEDRELKRHEIKIANVEARNRAAIAALTEWGANRRTALQEAGENTRRAQAAALDLMKLDRETKAVQSKLEQEYNLAVLKNLDLDNISDKDLATVYENVQESNGFTDYMKAWKMAHVGATPEQVSAAENKFVKDRINDYMRLRNEVMLGQSALNSYRQRAALGGSGITSLSPR